MRDRILNRELYSSIAKAFVDIVEFTLLSKNIHALDLLVSTNNTRAISFYSKVGFKEQRKILKRELACKQ